MTSHKCASEENCESRCCKSDLWWRGAPSCARVYFRRCSTPNLRSRSSTLVLTVQEP